MNQKMLATGNTACEEKKLLPEDPFEDLDDV